MQHKMFNFRIPQKSGHAYWTQILACERAKIIRILKLGGALLLLCLCWALQERSCVKNLVEPLLTRKNQEWPPQKARSMWDYGRWSLKPVYWVEETEGKGRSKQAFPFSLDVVKACALCPSIPSFCRRGMRTRETKWSEGVSNMQARWEAISRWEQLPMKRPGREKNKTALGRDQDRRSKARTEKGSALLSRAPCCGPRGCP